MAKLAEKIVFVKTYYVDTGKMFRYKRRWWRKRNDQDAVAIDDNKVFVSIPVGTIVAIFKGDFNPAFDRWILKEL